MFCKGKAGTWPPPRPLTQHEALVACPAAECNSLLPEVLQPCSSHLEDYIPVLHLTQAMSRLRLTTQGILKNDTRTVRRGRDETPARHAGTENTAEETGTVFKKKRDGAEGMAEPGCWFSPRRLGRELDGENCEWDEEVCVRVCVCFCMHKHVHTGSPALAELQKKR